MTVQADPGVWGVSTGYHDFRGDWHAAPSESIAAILRAMGAGPSRPPAPEVVTVRLDRPRPDIGAGRILAEDGATIDIDGPLPPDLPTGYHQFVPHGGGPSSLIVSPGRLVGPGGRQWGFATQLYATRSTASWGIGDLADLRRLDIWAAGLGAGFTLVNPLHAPAPGPPRQPSPYFPGSRCFLDPIYIAVEEVPGADGVAGLAEAASTGRALNSNRRIDRDLVWSLKEPVLEELFATSRSAPGFATYRARRGRALERFALYCAVAERHGADWREWPAGSTQDVDPGRQDFHSWLQWIAATQLEAAAEALGVVTDLAVGVDPSGPDSWIWAESFASGMRIGAPPDEFNTRGQDWGLPPFDPWRLRAQGYAPWIEALRSAMAHSVGLRVDHVMGLFRLYWIPESAEPTAGAYVRYPFAELLDILTLEAERAGAYVVGEDLGTVEDEVRRDLGERGVLSYRVWWFEDTPTERWPEAAMGAVTTHDLPTVAGVLTGSDVEAQRRLGMEPNEEASEALRERVRRQAPGGGTEAVIEAVYADLSHAPCRLLVATLDDVLAVEERPNMPGTTDEWPNWSIALPVPLEELEKRPLAGRVAVLLQRGRGG
jgi:4-alpha-glucanotransferase